MVLKNFTPLNPGLINKKQANNYVSRPKETESAVKTEEKYDYNEVVEHEPEEEIKSFVSPRAETISLPPDLKKLGLQPAGSSQFTTYQNVKLPISDDKVLVGIHQPITSSFRWLATLAIYILKRAHLALRTVGGKTVRIIKK